MVGIIGFVSSISAIVGVVFWFINPTVTIVCALITIIDSIIQVIFGDQNNLTSEIATVIISAIISLIAKTPTFETICFGLCLVAAVFAIIGWISMLISYKNFYK